MDHLIKKLPPRKDGIDPEPIESKIQTIIIERETGGRPITFEDLDRFSTRELVVFNQEILDAVEATKGEMK